MADTTITLMDNGPLLVKGTFALMDATGKPYTQKETVALCRCGSSKNKPFCDASHKDKFESAPRA